MREKYIQKIRAKCIEVNPEILELKFGCKGITDNRIWVLMNNGDWVIEDAPYNSHSIKEPREIIGRDITLADVLLTLEGTIGVIGNDDMRCGLMDGHLIIRDEDSNKRVRWNLKEPLHNQSEETLKFIADLI